MPEVDMIRAQLFALQDKEYQVFYSRLMPTLPPETVIGVRVPLLRKLAKQLADTPEAEVFLQELPHFYYEEKRSPRLSAGVCPGLRHSAGGNGALFALCG